MAFIREKTRKVSQPISEKIADVKQITAKNLKITNGDTTAHFNRLGYQGCPKLKCGRGHDRLELRSNEELIDMDRWPFVLEMYNTISCLDRTARTKINIFNGLLVLIQTCDKNAAYEYLSRESIELFVDELKKRYIKGIKGKTLQGIQNSVKTIVRELNLFNEKEISKIFFKFPNDHTPVPPYTDEEIKVIVKNLYQIFSCYRKHFLNGSVPDHFPLYDESKLNVTKASKGIIRSAWAKKISSGNNRDTWKMDMVRTAYYLTCFYTGINPSPLLNLRIIDIKDCEFIESSRGKYQLTTIKGRQKGRQNLDEVGFTRRSKDFFESWIVMVKILDPTAEAYIFPKVVNGRCCRHNGTSIQSGLNNSFEILGLPILSNQRFRATKASLLLRATDSIFSTSEGLNNKPDTVAKHYSDGNPTQNKMALAAVLDIRERTAKGESLSGAKNNSIFYFKDPIRQSTYTEASIPSLSPSGIRCTDPFSDKAKSLKSSLIDAHLAEEHDEIACHKFLECFGCENHAIIAEEADIWLMLSFRDVLLEVMSRPSINSMPGDLFVKISNTVESIISRLKKEFSDVYNAAQKRHMDAAHPLWASDDDFDLLKEIW